MCFCNLFSCYNKNASLSAFLPPSGCCPWLLDHLVLRRWYHAWADPLLDRDTQLLVTKDIVQSTIDFVLRQRIGHILLAPDPANAGQFLLLDRLDISMRYRWGGAFPSLHRTKLSRPRAFLNPEKRGAQAFVKENYLKCALSQSQCRRHSRWRITPRAELIE